MADLATLQIKVDTRDLHKLGVELVDVERQADKTERSTGKLTGAFGGLAKGAGIAVGAIGAAVIALGVDSTSTFADMEARLIGVAKTTDFSSKQLDVFTDRIFALGQEIEGVSTQQLQDIAGVAGQLGIKGIDNVVKFTETMGKLSLATDIVGDEGAASVARLLNVTGEGVETVDRFGAVLVALGNSSAATESEILSLATEVGQATSTFAVSSAETLAMGAAMKSLGVRAELGGSVVGRAMRSIEASIEAGGDQMRHLSEVTGIAEKDLKSAFGDNATAVFQKWVHGVGGMIDQGQSAATVLKGFGLSGEEVLKVLPTLAVNAGVLDDALALANDELERGTALDKEAAKAGEGLGAQWKVLKNIYGEAAYRVGKELAPSIKEVIADTRAWWGANNNLVAQDIAAWVGAGVEGVRTFISVVSQVDDVFAYVFGQMQKGWETITYGFELGGLKFAQMASGMSESADSLVVKLADKFSKIPLIGEDIAASFKETWYVGGKDAEKYTQQIAKLTEQHEFAITAIERVQRSEMDLTGAIKTRGAAAEKATKVETTGADKSAKAVEDANKRKTVSDTTYHAGVVERNADQVELAQYLLDETNRRTQSKYDYEMGVLEQRTDRMLEQAGDDIDLINQVADWHDAKQDELLEKYDENAKARKGIEDATMGFIRSANAAMVQAFVAGENTKTALARVSSEQLSNYAAEAATKGLGEILPALVSQIGAWVGLGTAKSGSEGKSWPERITSALGYLGAAGAAILGAKTVSNNFLEDGGPVGWILRNPGGGMVNEGSRRLDDVFAGFTRNARGGVTRNMIQGGEFVVNPRSTRKHRAALEAINEDRFFADGGDTLEDNAYTNLPEGWEDYVPEPTQRPKGGAADWENRGIGAGLNADRSVDPLQAWEAAKDINNAGMTTFGTELIGSGFNWGAAAAQTAYYYLQSVLSMFAGRAIGDNLFGAEFSAGGVIAELVDKVLGLLGWSLDDVWNYLRERPFMAEVIGMADAAMLPIVEAASSPDTVGGIPDIGGLVDDIFNSMLDAAIDAIKELINPVNLIKDFLGLANGGPLGSYENGTQYVPKTGNYLLHEGEEVTPRGQTPNYKTVEELQRLTAVLEAKLDKLTAYIEETTGIARKWDTNGLPPTEA